MRLGELGSKGDRVTAQVTGSEPHTETTPHRFRAQEERGGKHSPGGRWNRASRPALSLPSPGGHPLSSWEPVGLEQVRYISTSPSP